MILIERSPLNASFGILVMMFEDKFKVDNVINCEKACSLKKKLIFFSSNKCTNTFYKLLPYIRNSIIV